MDLNIIVQRNSECLGGVERTLRSALDWGYTTVALNTIVGTNCFSKEGVKIPECPPQIEIEDINPSCQVLSRLTAIVQDEKQCQQLISSPLVKKYDILALQPMNEKVFSNICANVEFDIMCIDLSNLRFPLKREQLKQAKERRIHFEIQYSQLFDGTDRSWTVANGRNLVSAGCKKNIIISSGATTYMQIRNPASVINLITLFGLSTRESKAALFRNGQVVLQQARMRTKTGKAIISIQDTEKLNSKETWLIEGCILNSSLLDKRNLEADISAEMATEKDVSVKEVNEVLPKRAKTD